MNGDDDQLDLFPDEPPAKPQPGAYREELQVGGRRFGKTQQMRELPGRTFEDIFRDEPPQDRMYTCSPEDIDESAGLRDEQ